MTLQFEYTANLLRWFRSRNDLRQGLACQWLQITDLSWFCDLGCKAGIVLAELAMLPNVLSSPPNVHPPENSPKIPLVPDAVFLRIGHGGEMAG